MRILYKLYELRSAAGLTITQLAELSGVSKTQINHIENGKGNPTVLTICLLAEALNVEPSELFSVEKKE